MAPLIPYKPLKVVESFGHLKLWVDSLVNVPAHINLLSVFQLRQINHIRLMTTMVYGAVYQYYISRVTRWYIV